MEKKDIDLIEFMQRFCKCVSKGIEMTKNE